MIDDDVELGKVMRPMLDKYQISLVQAETPQKGLEILANFDPDVVLLDMMFPETDGMMVCHEIRSTDFPWRDIPIIALSARAELTDRIVSLESGVDDYIVKPFELRELIARIRAVKRWQVPIAKPEQGIAVVVDETRMAAKIGRFTVDLTDMEMQILKALADAKGNVLSRLQILERIRRSECSNPAIIDTAVYRLRRKFRLAGAKDDLILTVRGRGYRLFNGRA